MDKLITITITDGVEEYTEDFIMEDAVDFEDVISRLKEDLGI